MNIKVKPIIIHPSEFGKLLAAGTASIGNVISAMIIDRLGGNATLVFTNEKDLFKRLGDRNSELGNRHLELIKEVQTFRAGLKNAIGIHSYNKNHRLASNPDEYCIAFYNGMERIVATLEGREVEFHPVEKSQQNSIDDWQKCYDHLSEIKDSYNKKIAENTATEAERIQYSAFNCALACFKSTQKKS